MGTNWPPMDERGPVISEGDVRAFESKIGATLPADYRDFLLQVNGGRTAQSHTTFGLRKGETILNSLHSLKEPDEQFDLETWWAKHRVPDELLLVGYDDGGNHVCLVIRGEHLGEVWYFDVLNERPEDANPRVPWHNRRDFIRLAGTFREFMSSLTELNA